MISSLFFFVCICLCHLKKKWNQHLISLQCSLFYFLKFTFGLFFLFFGTNSLGTFVFTFVAQHAVHLVFQSIRPSDRTVKEFEKSSTLAIIISTTIALGLGFSIYMTFWENTSSDIFHLYPPSRLINLCRILLCISMLLTYPFPFMTVRELLIISFISTTNQKEKARPNESAEGLLLDQQTSSNNSSSWLIPGQERQLKRKYHIALTITIWTATVILALAAGSLGDVLNLTGCATATGTLLLYLWTPKLGIFTTDTYFLLTFFFHVLLLCTSCTSFFMYVLFVLFSSHNVYIASNIFIQITWSYDIGKYIILLWWICWFNWYIL